jgi:hypothetical protein
LNREEAGEVKELVLILKMSLLDILQCLASVLGKLEVEPCRHVDTHAHTISIFGAFMNPKVIVRRAESVYQELNPPSLICRSGLRSIVGDNHLLLILSVLNEDAGTHRVEVWRNKVVIEVPISRIIAPGKNVSSYHLEGIGICIEDAFVIN